MTPSATSTPPPTLSSSSSPTNTPSPTLPVCRAGGGLNRVVALVGNSGVAPAASTAASGNGGMYTSGSCATGFKAFFMGPRLAYAIFLNASTPLGGVLSLTTCGHTADNTVLYVGTGCPTWAAPFGCVAGADGGDGSSACGSNALAAALTVTATQQVYYVQLGGFAGAPVTSGLAWSYAPPPQTRSGSATGSRSRTRSRSRSRTRSASATRSRSRKRKV